MTQEKLKQITINFVNSLETFGPPVQLIKYHPTYGLAIKYPDDFSSKSSKPLPLT